MHGADWKLTLQKQYLAVWPASHRYECPEAQTEAVNNQ